VLGLDPTDVHSLTLAYQKIYQQVPIILRFFRKYVPGCANCVLREIAPMIGVRESRRIIGDYVLTGDDVINGARFDDAVAMGGYMVDIHRPCGTWVESYNVKAYQIPFRCLVARDVEGLLMAGKCFSGTHHAVASTRVIPICMAQGQAAGTAAALAVRHGCSPREIGIRLLQETLIAQGAELGQTLGEPDPELIERIGVLPWKEPQTEGDRDRVSQAENAWIK
jgi:hypothetical protein